MTKFEEMYGSIKDRSVAGCLKRIEAGRGDATDRFITKGKGPAMQGIPHRTPEVAALRKAFVGADHPMVTADYAELEKRALASMTPEQIDAMMAAQRKAKGE